MSRVIEYQVPPDSPQPERLKDVDYWVEWRIGLDVVMMPATGDWARTAGTRKKTVKGSRKQFADLHGKEAAQSLWWVGAWAA